MGPGAGLAGSLLADAFTTPTQRVAQATGTFFEPPAQKLANKTGNFIGTPGGQVAAPSGYGYDTTYVGIGDAVGNVGSNSSHLIEQIIDKIKEMIHEVKQMGEEKSDETCGGAQNGDC